MFTSEQVIVCELFVDAECRLMSIRPAEIPQCTMGALAQWKKFRQNFILLILEFQPVTIVTINPRNWSVSADLEGTERKMIENTVIDLSPVPKLSSAVVEQCTDCPDFDLGQLLFIGTSTLDSHRLLGILMSLRSRGVSPPRFKEDVIMSEIDGDIIYWNKATAL